VPRIEYYYYYYWFQKYKNWGKVFSEVFTCELLYVPLKGHMEHTQTEEEGGGFKTPAQGQSPDNSTYSSYNIPDKSIMVYII